LDKCFINTCAAYVNMEFCFATFDEIEKCNFHMLGIRLFYAACVDAGSIMFETFFNTIRAAGFQDNAFNIPNVMKEISRVYHSFLELPSNEIIPLVLILEDFYNLQCSQTELVSLEKWKNMIDELMKYMEESNQHNIILIPVFTGNNAQYPTLQNDQERHSNFFDVVDFPLSLLPYKMTCELVHDAYCFGEKKIGSNYLPSPSYKLENEIDKFWYLNGNFPNYLVQICNSIFLEGLNNNVEEHKEEMEIAPKLLAGKVVSELVTPIEELACTLFEFAQRTFGEMYDICVTKDDSELLTHIYTGKAIDEKAEWVNDAVLDGKVITESSCSYKRIVLAFPLFYKMADICSNEFVPFKFIKTIVPQRPRIQTVSVASSLIQEQFESSAFSSPKITQPPALHWNVLIEIDLYTLLIRRRFATSLYEMFPGQIEGTTTFNICSVKIEPIEQIQMDPEKLVQYEVGMQDLNNVVLKYETTATDAKHNYVLISDKGNQHLIHARMFMTAAEHKDHQVVVYVFYAFHSNYDNQNDTEHVARVTIWYNKLAPIVMGNPEEYTTLLVYITNADMTKEAVQAVQNQCKNLIVISKHNARSYFAPNILPYYEYARTVAPLPLVEETDDEAEIPKGDSAYEPASDDDEDKVWEKYVPLCKLQEMLNQ